MTVLVLGLAFGAAAVILGALEVYRYARRRHEQRRPGYISDLWWRR